jgi:hypothetical protein
VSPSSPALQLAGVMELEATPLVPAAGSITGFTGSAPPPPPPLSGGGAMESEATPLDSVAALMTVSNSLALSSPLPGSSHSHSAYAFGTNTAQSTSVGTMSHQVNITTRQGPSTVYYPMEFVQRPLEVHYSSQGSIDPSLLSLQTTVASQDSTGPVSALQPESSLEVGLTHPLEMNVDGELFFVYLFDYYIPLR